VQQWNQTDHSHCIETVSPTHAAWDEAGSGPPEIRFSGSGKGGNPCRSAQRATELSQLATDGRIIAAAMWAPSINNEGALGLLEERGDRFEPAWLSGATDQDRASPEKPKVQGRRGAFQPVSKSEAQRQGCYKSLAKSREKNAMWCPLGTGATTAGR
jgi:hypothetical protein